jgi:hypothetical protein
MGCVLPVGTTRAIMRVAELGARPRLFQRTVYREALEPAGPMPIHPQSASLARQLLRADLPTARL